MISGKVEPAIAFMLGTTLALLFNFRSLSEQSAAIDRHAKAALSMCAILCSAGVFTGILKGSGMLAAMAKASIAQIPPGSRRTFPWCSAWSPCPLACSLTLTLFISGFSLCLLPPFKDLDCLRRASLKPHYWVK